MSNETATLVKLSAAEQAAAVKKGDVTSRELVEAHLKVIEAAEPSIKAFLKVSGDVALEQADAFDAKSAEDKAALPELAGVPIAIKDMIVTKGIEPTNSPRAPPPSTPPTRPPTTRGIPSACPAVPVVAPPPQSPHSRHRSPSAPTLVARFASPAP